LFFGLDYVNGKKFLFVVLHVEDLPQEQLADYFVCVDDDKFRWVTGISTVQKPIRIKLR